MMDDRDLALEIARAWFDGRCPEIEGCALASPHSNPVYVLSGYVEHALATVRKEARAAAFEESIQIAKEEAFERRLAHSVYERLIEGVTVRSQS